jgi:tetratricopeptide (TPR) repeat protein
MRRRRVGRRWALAAGVLLLAGIGIGVMRLRQANSLPLAAWDGPDPTSGTREAEARLLQAARRASKGPRAQLELARFYLDDARPFEALWVLRDLRRLDPGALQSRLLVARALAAGQLYPAALNTLQAALRDHPGDPEAVPQLAELQLSLGRPAAAVATLRRAAARQALPDDLVLLLARSLEASGDAAAALSEYRHYQQLQPKSDQACLRIGRLLLRMGRMAGARQALVAAEALDGQSAEARYYQGLIELGHGPSREEEARQKFAEAMSRDERFVPAPLQLSAYALRHHDWKGAASLLSRVARLDPDNPDALLQLSQVQRALGNQAAALYWQGSYYAARDARPRATQQYRALTDAGIDPRGPLLLSNSYVRMDQKQKATEVARAGLRRHPGDVELTERLIALDLVSGNGSEAEQLCRDWLRRDPASPRPNWLLGRVRLAKQDEQGALQLFQRAARADPTNGEFWFSLGTVYAARPSRANWEMAARYFGKAVQIKPDEARFRYNLGIALQNIDNLEGARRQFLRSMDLDVHQSAPLNNVVQVARAMRQYDQVEFWAPLVRDVEGRLREELPAWKRVWDQPRDTGGYLPLARFLESTGELRQARNILEQAVALRPDLAPARAELEKLRRSLDVL